MISARLADAGTYTPSHERSDDPSVAAATARLTIELNLPAGRVGGVARRARHELSGVPPGALPELVERLTRERLAHPA
jgi:hypothetical protein